MRVCVCFSGRTPEEICLVLPFHIFLLQACPSHFVHFNLSYGSGLMVVIILLIIGMTFHHFPPLAVKYAAPPGQRFRQCRLYPRNTIDTFVAAP